MVALLCGLLNLGDAGPAGPRLDAMADTLAMGRPADRAGMSEGPFTAALVQRTGGMPAAMRTGCSGGMLVLGNFDFAFWRDDGGGERPADADQVAQAMSSDIDRTLDRLDGEYAFACMDTESGTLRLICDRAATRPLFYVHHPGAWFAFASLPAPLRRAGFIDGTRALDVIARLAVSNPWAQDRTWLAGLRRVLAAHCLQVTADRLDQRRYWRLDHRPPLPPGTDYQTVTTTVRDLVDQAVRRRLPPGGRAFSHLSGGLDSTAIAVLAARAMAQRGGRLIGYSLVPQPIDGVPAFIDERPAVASTVAAQGNIDLVEISGPSADHLPDMQTSIDFPHGLNPELEYEQILAHAAGSGASTVLSGFGGDEVVSYARRGTLADLVLHLRWGAAYRDVIRQQGWRTSLKQLAAQVLMIGGLGGVDSFLRRVLGKAPSHDDMMLRFISPAFRDEAVRGALRLRADTRLYRARRFDHGHLAHVAEELAWRAARHGLSYSFPLMDRDLVEYAVRIPARFLVLGGRPRNVFRDAMQNVLPDPVRLRTEKLLIDPGTMYRFAAEKDRLLEIIDGLRGTPAEDVFDLEEMRRVARTLPDPQNVKQQINDLASRGIQYLPEPGIVLYWPLNLARFTAMQACRDET